MFLRQKTVARPHVAQRQNLVALGRVFRDQLDQPLEIKTFSYTATSSYEAVPKWNAGLSITA